MVERDAGGHRAHRPDYSPSAHLFRRIMKLKALVASGALA
jgi:hypothetical protein